ncbi:glycosyltransferase family 2 protein [Flavobacterium sp.]|jgi:glycosyltransferase involved in cell wall biosynthesis|uniref:glycosyltransferase family 2 protein n=1 Tax=Flavobacterium sp. TaxID=239 RepID=UPI0037C0E7D1
MKHKISIFIITYNEAHIITKCLEKLKTFDEIIVVDSGSTDATVSICESFGAKVISHKFENFGLQKQLALEQTAHNWVLSLDADEVLSDALISEIHNINHGENVKAYTIPRTHIFLNKVFKYGAESKRPILRLFDKNFGKFTPNKVHETIEINGVIGKLQQEMLHYTVFDINTAIEKQIKYALLSGELLHEKKKKSCTFKIIIKFPFDFIRYYFLQRNFLNGYEGFTWSMFAAFSNYLKYAKLKELSDNNS